MIKKFIKIASINDMNEFKKEFEILVYETFREHKITNHPSKEEIESVTKTIDENNEIFSNNSEEPKYRYEKYYLIKKMLKQIEELYTIKNPFEINKKINPSIASIETFFRDMWFLDDDPDYGRRWTDLKLPDIENRDEPDVFDMPWSEMIKHVRKSNTKIQKIGFMINENHSLINTKKILSKINKDKKMIKFASHILPINELFPNKNKVKFVKVAQSTDSIMSQQEAVEKFMPMIESEGDIFEKFTQIEARPTNPGELIETITSDGKETQNIAKEGDFVVKNIGGSGEEYILSGDKLAKRYKQISDNVYQAIGECMGIVYEGPEIQFMASWGEPMVLKPGDMVVTPLPNKGEVYRIARKEFESTYRLKENSDNLM